MSFLFGGSPFDGYDRGGRRSLNSGGGGGGGTQQTTSYQTNIPEYLRGPAESMVARGTTLSEQPYQPYSGERIAGFSPMQTQAFSQLGAMGPQQQFGQAGQSISGAQEFGAVGAQRAMGYDPTQFNMYQMAQPDKFGTTQSTQYMSPYQQAVTDVAKREALSEAQLLNRDLASKAAKAGAFGGSRFGVEQALLGSKLAQNLSDIQVKGSQSAFENAQAQFERDRAAQMAASGQNLQAALTVQQQQDAARQAAAKFNLEGAQFGAQTGLQSAAQLSQLGTAEQEANLKRISAQQAAGAQQQALEQQRLDSAYQQAMEQRDWEKNQLGFLSGLIRGTPFSTSQLQTSTVPSASTASQLASLGLGAYGLSSLLGKKEGGAIKGYAKGGKIEGYADGGSVDMYPDAVLQAVVAGKSDVVPAPEAERELRRRKMLRTAVSGHEAQQALADSRSLADRAEEESGVAALPADNMEFADGGIVGYAAGGLPAGYDPAVYEMYEDPTSGEIYPRKKVGVLQAYGERLKAQAQGKPSVAPAEAPAVAPVSRTETVAPAVAAPATPAAGPARAPRATPGTPATAAVTEQLATKVDPLQQQIMDYMAATKASNADLAKELAKGQQNVDDIRSDVKGIAALRAAAAIAQGGPGGTIAQLGRGLGVAGEEAARGINQIQAARQGLLAQRIQMAQLERAANQGDITAQLQLAQLRQDAPLREAQAKLYGAQAGYYGAAAGTKAGAGGNLKQLKATQSAIQAELKGLQGKVDPASQARAKLLQQQLSQVTAQIASGAGLNLTTGFVPGGSGNVVRSSLFED